MLGEFEARNAQGLRGQIMMVLSKELLGERSDVSSEVLTPQQWYDALFIREEIVLPDFQYNGDDPIERLVYATEIEKESQPKNGFTVIASKIFRTYEEGNLLRVFVTTYSQRYKLYGNRLVIVWASVVPSAITYQKDNNGNYTLYEYEQTRDGSFFTPSIREFCRTPISNEEIQGLADQIISHYVSNDDLRTLHMNNLYSHLINNGIEDAVLLNTLGEVIFSTSNR